MAKFWMHVFQPMKVETPNQTLDLNDKLASAAVR